MWRFGVEIMLREIKDYLKKNNVKPPQCILD